MNVKKLEAGPLCAGEGGEGRKRAAVYARVSADGERPEHSLNAQMSFYTELIQSDPRLEFAGVYSDYGISGTGVKKRAGFLGMLADCEAGLIDVIFTKSVSRFARNTVDLLETCRRLRELGVEVRFSREGISTFSGEGELMLTIFASFAQEESRSISGNVKWGIRKRFEQGIPCRRAPVYGYDWSGNEMVINPGEAEVVRRIYSGFLRGETRPQTARALSEAGIKTRSGAPWGDSSLKQILTNITYTGNMVLQKYYVEDPLTHKCVRNRGAVPRYFAENTNPPIIDMETFQRVQREMDRRRSLGIYGGRDTCFSKMLTCSHHPGIFFTAGSSGRGKPRLWRCFAAKKKGGRCPCGIIREDTLKEVCAAALDIPEFDEAVFRERVSGILVFPGHTLEFHFKDGETALHGREPEGRARGCGK